MLKDGQEDEQDVLIREDEKTEGPFRFPPAQDEPTEANDEPGLDSDDSEDPDADDKDETIEPEEDLDATARFQGGIN